MSLTFFVALLLIGLLSAVHLFAGKLRFLVGVPRSRWLSLAGGASVGYVFIQLFPELSAQQEVIRRELGPDLAWLEHHIYLIALAGLVVFYGLERLAKTSRQLQRASGQGEATSRGVFWLHIVSFAFYNALIGYLLLHREQPGLRSLVFYGAAMALHFLVNDYGLREHHQQDYRRSGRWILSLAIFAGWLVGALTSVHEVWLAVLTAWLAGGVILNVLKEELPAERESRFPAFALGAMLYAALLLIV